MGKLAVRERPLYVRHLKTIFSVEAFHGEAALIPAIFRLAQILPTVINGATYFDGKYELTPSIYW
jgi:hypothetical protein